MKRIATITLALLTSLALAACGGEDNDDADVMPGMDGDTSSATDPADTGEHNSADVMFTQMMIPHHAQAVEMSDLILAKDDVDDDLTALAEQIKAAQQPEIELMEGWLDEWGEDMPAMGGMDDGMNGMMSAAEMVALEEATGDDAARMYLESMKVHHEGAIEMAQTELDDGSSAEAIELAEAIIAAQEAEIVEIDDLLASL